MKVFITSLLLVLVTAEPPPSNSYLPPGSSPGYPQGSQKPGSPAGSGVVAARSFDQGHHVHGNGLSRNGQYDHKTHAKLGQGAQEYDSNGALGRNFLDVRDEPANYNFGYMVNDFVEGTDFGHHEERQEEKTHGQYHVVLPDGRKQQDGANEQEVHLMTVQYEADGRGFKPQISYQDTEELTRSEYDLNANSHFNGYDTNANTRSNGYDTSANIRSHGYDTSANTRSGSYDSNINRHNFQNGVQNNGYSRSGGY